MTEAEKQTKTANTFFTLKGTFKLCTKSLELGVAVQACDPRPEEAEERRSTTSLRPGLHSLGQQGYRRRFCLNKGGGGRGDDPWFLFPPSALTMLSCV